LIEHFTLVVVVCSDFLQSSRMAASEGIAVSQTVLELPKHELNLQALRERAILLQNELEQNREELKNLCVTLMDILEAERLKVLAVLEDFTEETKLREELENCSREKLLAKKTLETSRQLDMRDEPRKEVEREFERLTKKRNELWKSLEQIVYDRRQAKTDLKMIQNLEHQINSLHLPNVNMEDVTMFINICVPEEKRKQVLDSVLRIRANLSSLALQQNELREEIATQKLQIANIVTAHWK